MDHTRGSHSDDFSDTEPCHCDAPAAPQSDQPAQGERKQIEILRRWLFTVGVDEQSKRAEQLMALLKREGIVAAPASQPAQGASALNILTRLVEAYTGPKGSVPDGIRWGLWFEAKKFLEAAPASQPAQGQRRADEISARSVIERHYPSIAGRVAVLKDVGELKAAAEWDAIAKDFYAVLQRPVTPFSGADTNEVVAPTSEHAIAPATVKEGIESVASSGADARELAEKFQKRLTKEATARPDGVWWAGPLFVSELAALLESFRAETLAQAEAACEEILQSRDPDDAKGIGAANLCAMKVAEANSDSNWLARQIAKASLDGADFVLRSDSHAISRYRNGLKSQLAALEKEIDANKARG